MSASPMVAAAVLAALWPFGRDRGGEPVTIESLEKRVVEINVDQPIPASEEKAIESYRRFLELAAEDPLLRAEAMRRLADLEIEAAEIATAEGSSPSLDASIALYRELLESHPDYAKNDLVLYQLARAYEAQGDIDAALATLDQLVSAYPDTIHYDEANFRRGEALFVGGRYEEAEDAYRRVLELGPQTTFYEQAIYKHGWSLFKQERHEEALESFLRLLDLNLGADPDTDSAALFAEMGRAEQELVEDTLRVGSIAFSYLDGPASIEEALSRTGPRPYAYILYMNLGDLYVEQERWQDAAGAYHAFTELEPWHEKAPLLQAEAIGAYERGGFADLVLDGKRGFVERYGPDSPYWERHVFDEQPEVVAQLKAHLTDLAAHHHALAQETKAAEEYAAAGRWYRTYLATFPDGEDAAATNFLLAEVLYESGDYASAAEEYERTAYAYPFHSKGGEAGYAALLAYAEHEERLSGAERTAWHRRSIDSALRFADVYPEHPEAAAVETNAAERLFELNDFVAARDVAMRVVLREPPAPAALERTAWIVAAHSEFDLGSYADAESAYLAALDLVPADDPQHAPLTERLASSIYKQGEAARELGDDQAAVEHFLRVGLAAPTTGIRATAEYDAAAALMRLGDWTRAATVLEDFRSRYPDDALVADATASLAVAYLESGDTARAAGEFERIAETDGDPDVRREASWRAAELWAESGDAARAALAFERYVERHPTPAPAAIDARQRLAELARARNDRTAELRWLTEIVSADAVAGAERTERTRLLAAQAQLELAKPQRDAFRAVQLVAPLDRSLARKRELMEAALTAYRRAADYGLAEVTTAATYEIAELYHALGRDLLASERPAELGPDELSQYEILLEEQAFPFEEQAIEVHELNVGRLSEGVYDEWVRASLEALAELVPVRYAKEEIGEKLVSAVR